MPLDLAILGGDGRPACSASIGAKAHARLIKLIAGMELANLDRLQDYYADVEFSPTELALLSSDIEAACAATENDEEIASFLCSLQAIVAEARAMSVPVFALAD
jgi:hypothetical protein